MAGAVRRDAGAMPDRCGAMTGAERGAASARGDGPAGTNCPKVVGPVGAEGGPSLRLALNAGFMAKRTRQHNAPSDGPSDGPAADGGEGVPGSPGVPGELAGMVEPLAAQLRELDPEGGGAAATEQARRFLRAAARLGLRLTWPADERGGASASGQAATWRRTLEQRQLPLIELHKQILREGEAAFWAADDPFHALFTRALISAGHTSAAFDYAATVLRHRPDDRELAYLQALALARGRNVKRARDAVERLLAGLEADDAASSPDGAGEAAGTARRRLRVETLSLAGRLFKDLGRSAKQPAEARRCYRRANARYAEAEALSGDWYPAINAATTALLAGRTRAARRTAARVVERAGADLTADGRTDDYWLLATLGEASLILGADQDAIDYYRRAVELAGERFGDIASMRRNVELLGRRIEIPPALRHALALGDVVVFAGHMIDHPDRVARRGLAERFPPAPALERKLRDAIDARLEAIDPVAGYCSAANGADLLFAERMLHRGRELHVVLPFAMEDFYRTSVDFGLDELAGWRRRCDAVLARAQVHYATEERYLGDDTLFEFTNRVMQGLTILRADQFGVTPRALVAFDQTNQNAGGGGTSGFAHKWTAGGRPLEVIDLGELRRSLPAKAERLKLPSPPDSSRPTTIREQRRVMCMLFCDVHNFSRVEESQSPRFFRRFMRMVDAVLERAPRQPAFANTWGDALYLVFRRPADCAELALRLVERTEKVDWRRYGLPGESALRVALHAGPVYRRMNKVIGRSDFFGTHVNLAARIEPVTTPGSVFVSEHFAAELTLDDPASFVCEYVGQRELAKNWGQAPLYRLDRA